MFSKILPGGAAEQAGKLGEGMRKMLYPGKKTKQNDDLLFRHKRILFFSSSYLRFRQEVHLFLLRC